MTDPTSLNDAEAVQYSFLMTCWSNQWTKLLRLKERGALNDREWNQYAQVAADTFRTPGGAEFKANNRIFDDLFAALASFEHQSEFSTWTLGNRGSS